MEFPFDVNILFSDEISVVDRSLRPARTNALNMRQRRAELCKVIDDIGAASARAQSLHGPITTSARLSTSDHHLYIITDSYANEGRGVVVGLLKVGCKKLFIYDYNGVQHEMEPLCILDFYVHESCQRRGYGKQLFEYMLQVEAVNVRHLAIDRPSPKFLSFLHKHYKLSATIPQVNNFVIFDGFFHDRPPTGVTNKRQRNFVADGTMSPINRQNMMPLRDVTKQHEVDMIDEHLRMNKDDIHSSLVTSSPNTFYRPSSGALRNSPTVNARPMLYRRHAVDNRINVGSRPVADSPAALHRDASTLSSSLMAHQQQQQQLQQQQLCGAGVNGDGDRPTTFIDRWPANFKQTQTQLPSHNWQETRRVAGTGAHMNSAWKIFGVAPRSWPSAATSNNASAPPPPPPSASSMRKYQRTALW